MTCTTAAVNCKLAYSIGSVEHTLPVGLDLAGCARKAGGNIHDGIVEKEVSRLEQQRDGLDGHDWKILGGWEMHHAERVP